MSSSGIRRRNLFDPASGEPYRLSRSKVALFLECPRCFYLDRRSGIGRPGSPPFTLNNAVDLLWKREFDAYRLDGAAHPLQILHGVEAIPFKHPDVEQWRDALRGVQVVHAPSGFLVFGALDDVWVTPAGELIVVDYKATSTEAAITMDGPYRDGYKRQIEVYQWLLRRNGFRVSDTAYFLFANARKDRGSFDARLDFSVQLLSYQGSDAWIEDALIAARECLEHESPPPSVEGCEWCAYRRAAAGEEGRGE